MLLTERADATRKALQTHARSVGAADIMVPTELHVVEKLPLLGSGKPDFVAATRIAAQADGQPIADKKTDEEDAHAPSAP
ncbi:MAG: hypothetical protein EON55_21895 [Alphaproteobacteria bacterium]|nr:MAG: hypothetical protein EON55_21895 [Alphaproteobacteria bacterium]